MPVPLATGADAPGDQNAAAASAAGGLPDRTPEELVRRLRADLASGALDLPPAGRGRTAERWRAVYAWGAEDLVLAKLRESHTDAVGILTDAGESPVPGALYGVWASASGGTGLTAQPDPGREGWLLHGRQRFASGAHLLDRALVAAPDEDGVVRLLDVPLGETGWSTVAGSWPSIGMDSSDSGEIVATGAPADREVGDPGWYLSRPGFWVGGIGVAAVWAGGARAVAESLRAGLAERQPDDHQLAHLGAVSARLLALESTLDRAAVRVDADPGAEHRALALAVRELAERTAAEVVDRAGRAAGPALLSLDRRYAQRVADLAVFVRQSHAERDLARLAADALPEPWGELQWPLP
ncbi:MAG TPA: hypothetical protein VK894_08265 [Jiangellales bacterium]|nr:hypothetical protein [Jiangellales bacterium]